MGLTIATNTGPAGSGITLASAGKLYVPLDVRVFTETAAAISTSYAGSSITVAGQVAGVEGIAVGGSNGDDLGSRVTVLDTGIVSGQGTGISVYGANSSVLNQGLVEGDGAGVAFGENRGTAHAFNYGKFIGIVGVQHDALALGILDFHNFGEVIGLYGTAFDSLSATAIDVITNAGRFVGDVRLGGGADRFDGRGGTVTGTIFGGDGNDTFLPGAGEDSIDGGNGVDTVSYRSGAAVVVALDGSYDNAGAAAGDELTGIENLTGSTLGNDRLMGDGQANELRGLGGIDTLSGGAGADRLEGGRGADLLLGGFGNDTFYFAGIRDAGDVIADFKSVSGNDDVIYLNPNGFGGALANGYLDGAFFQTRADNLAQDGDDRFIFRTTDQTLWFDADGTGAGAAVMLADLQAGAVLTASDIYIFG